MASSQLLSWCTSEVAKLLFMPEEDAKGVASYVLSFPDENAVRDYLRDVLGTNSAFTDELIERRFYAAPAQTQAQPIKEQSPVATKPAKGAGRGRGRGPQPKPLPQLAQQPPRAINPEVMNNAVIFEKKGVEDDFWGGAGKKGKKPTKPKTSGKEYEQYVDPNTVNKPYNVTQVPILIEKKKGKGGVPEPTKKMLCGCQGTVHPYVNNCLNCGRIACEIEGDGDCFHCGQHIEWHPPTEESAPVTSGFQTRKTITQSKTLLYDDQNDYYNLNDTWLSPEEKKQIREREKKKFEEAEERKRKFTFDFAGRKILSIFEDDQF